MYSQNDEEAYIVRYVNESPVGRFLDLGAYDGENLSNTRALALLGWGGTCVDASPTVFKQLRKLYRNSKKVSAVNVAVGARDGRVVFHDNPNAVATAVEGEMDRWPDEEFNKVEVPLWSVSTLLRRYPGPYRFISIDIEGMDYEVLVQMDLNALGCDLICVEHNGKILEECKAYIQQFGFKVLLINGENLLMGR